MKVLGYIFDIFCRILAVVYSIIFIPVLGIMTVILITAAFLFGIFEWIFTGDSEHTKKISRIELCISGEILGFGNTEIPSTEL